MRTTLLAAALAAAVASGRAAAAEPAPVVQITAHRFAFDPPEVHLTRGQTATLRVTSRDVTHGLFLRPLGIDAEIHPGETLNVTVTPKAAGRYTAICDHFCGAGHGNMKLTVVVDEP